MEKSGMFMDQLEEYAKQEEWTEAAALLECTDVQRLPWPERKRAAQVLADLPEELYLRMPLLSVRRIQLGPAR